MPELSARAWTAIWPAIAAHWPWSGSRPRPRKRPAASAASDRPWRGSASDSRCAARVWPGCVGCPCRRSGGTNGSFPSSIYPDDLRMQLASWQRILLPIDGELAALTDQLQAAAPKELPSYLGAMTWELLH